MSRPCDVEGCPKLSTDHLFYERGEEQLRIVLHLHYCPDHGAGLRVAFAALDEESAVEKRPRVPGVVSSHPGGGL